MLDLIFIIIFGLLIGYFATINTTFVTIRFTPQTLMSVPIYVIVLISTLVGIILAWIIHLMHTFSSTMTIKGKERAIEEDRRTIKELSRRVDELETENEVLRTQLVEHTPTHKKEHHTVTAEET